MKKLVLLVLVAAAAWYGWKQYPQFAQRRPGHEAVVQNDTGQELQRVRLTVDGQTFVKESLPDGERAPFPFKVNRDASFHLVWQWTQRPGENEWQGGMVPHGPMLQRHIMVIDGDGNVLYRAENK
jgi:hypothetical protein